MGLAYNIKDVMDEDSPQEIIAVAYRERLIREKLTSTENYMIDVYQRVETIKGLATELKMSEDTVKRSFRTIKNKLKMSIETLVTKYLFK